MPKKKKSTLKEEREREKTPHPLRQSYGPEDGLEAKNGDLAVSQQDHENEPQDAEDDDEDDDVLGFGGALGGLGGLIEKSNTKDEDGDFEKEKMKLLLSHFNSDQMSRYEAFRRANINRSSVKKLANSVLNQSITANVAVSLSGASKVFVGEIVEKAREVQARMEREDEDSSTEAEAKPITPDQLREAWRLFKLESGTVPQAHWRRQGGDGAGMMFR